MFDLVNSKGAPVDLKVHVREVLEHLQCLHERTGNDAYLVVTKSAAEAMSIIDTIRDRTLQFVGRGENEFHGLRASITKGDCILRNVVGHDPRLMTITDRAGTPDIPNTAYQMEEIKVLLGKHGKLTVDDQIGGVALDREVAIEVGTTDDQLKLEAKGIHCLGRWSHKRITGDAYFFVRPTSTESTS